ncbi:MAG: hypothetical protein IPJ86_16505 [Bacteroidetes bacterium]|nr:hypothetical protein [Bacteroidota bacterium]
MGFRLPAAGCRLWDEGYRLRSELLAACLFFGVGEAIVGYLLLAVYFWLFAFFGGREAILVLRIG